MTSIVPNYSRAEYHQSLIYSGIMVATIAGSSCSECDQESGGSSQLNNDRFLRKHCRCRLCLSNGRVTMMLCFMATQEKDMFFLQFQV